jgi:integrase/recombinase XerD
MNRQLKPGQHVLKPAEVKLIIASVKGFRDRIIVKLAAQCGLRREEIATLKTNNIDQSAEQLWVTGKGGKRRMVPISSELLQEINYLVGKRRGYVFPAAKKRHAGLHVTAINRIFAQAGQAAGIKNPNPALKNINPHSLRHYYARRLKDAGVPLEAVQAVLGHESIKTTMDVYGLMSTSQIDETVRGSFEA